MTSPEDKKKKLQHHLPEAVKSHKGYSREPGSDYKEDTRSDEEVELDDAGIEHFEGKTAARTSEEKSDKPDPEDAGAESTGNQKTQPTVTETAGSLKTGRDTSPNKGKTLEDHQTDEGEDYAKRQTSDKKAACAAMPLYVSLS